MFPSTVDPSPLIRRDNTELTGLVILQLDDSMAIVTDTFMQEEEAASHRYRSSPRHILSTEATLFNGSHVQRTPDDNIRKLQSDKIAKLEPPTDEK